MFNYAILDIERELRERAERERERTPERDFTVLSVL